MQTPRPVTGVQGEATTLLPKAPRQEVLVPPESGHMIRQQPQL